MRPSSRMWQVLMLSVLVAGCSTTPATTTPGDARSMAPTPGPLSSVSAATATAAAALPGGLLPRPGLPPLVDGEAAACIPGCGIGRVANVDLPAGRYQTAWFFGGFMTLEIDGSTWSIREDSNGELAIFLPGDTEYAVAFWIDPVPYLHGQPASGVGHDAGAFIDRLATHPDLVVSTSEPTSIGEVPARAVDIWLAATAGQDEADCGVDPCISFIKNPAFDHVGGILGDDVYRFYFADVAYSGTDHLLVVMVEGRDRSHLDSITPTIEQLLRTVTIPARPAAP